MEELKEYTIPFVGLKIGEHEFNFQIGNAFFEHFEYDEFNSANLNLKVTLVKKATHLEFYFDLNGSVNVFCDITNEPFDQEISGDYHFVVKFGEEYNEDHEDLLILPHGSHQVNIQQFVYETVILAVPAKKVHPGIEDGTLHSEILDKLDELSLGNDEDSNDNEDEIDPRWEKLKGLITDK